MGLLNKKKYKDPITFIYKFNEETNAYVIEVSLDDYDELFNGWDASPLRMRDLEPELMDYIEDAGFEIPFKHKLEFVFYMPKDKENDDKEIKSVQTIRNNFKTQISFIDKALKRNNRKIGTYIIMSIIFLLAAYLIPETTDLGLMLSVLMEGLFIGGWVLLWEAFALFFFASHDLRQRRIRFVKFLESTIKFNYIK